MAGRLRGGLGDDRHIQAERAGMSRSTFALKFKETVGASPNA